MRRSGDRDLTGLGRRIGWAVVGLALATLVAAEILRETGHRLAYPLIVLYLLAVTATILIGRRTEAQPVPETMREDPAVERSFPDADDAVRAAIERWDRRLTLRSGGPDVPVPTILVDLIDERLRLHHHLDRTTHPERVRQLVSARMWALLSLPPRRSLAPSELDALLTEMEAL